jgi:hypothetical protein
MVCLRKNREHFRHLLWCGWILFMFCCSVCLSGTPRVSIRAVRDDSSSLWPSRTVRKILGRLSDGLPVRHDCFLPFIIILSCLMRRYETNSIQLRYISINMHCTMQYVTALPSSCSGEAVWVNWLFLGAVELHFHSPIRSQGIVLN